MPSLEPVYVFSVQTAHVQKHHATSEYKFFFNSRLLLPRLFLNIACSDPYAIDVAMWWRFRFRALNHANRLRLLANDKSSAIIVSKVAYTASAYA